MSRKFTVGEVVELISGSPKMTVTEACSYDAKKYEVTWFEGSTIHKQTVDESALKPRSLCRRCGHELNERGDVA